MEVVRLDQGLYKTRVDALTTPQAGRLRPTPAQALPPQTALKRPKPLTGPRCISGLPTPALTRFVVLFPIKLLKSSPCGEGGGLNSYAKGTLGCSSGGVLPARNCGRGSTTDSWASSRSLDGARDVLIEDINVLVLTYIDNGLIRDRLKQIFLIIEI